MAPTMRPKACHACASSKRRCDKQLPECQRCLDRDVDCIYPQPKRRRNDRPLADPGTGPPLSLESAIVEAYADSEVDTWPSFPDLEIGLQVSSGMETGELEPYGLLGSERIYQDDERHQVSTVARPWFLREETWLMHPRTPGADCSIAIDFEPYVDAVRSMLYQWVADGHNSFIHAKLYESVLPMCLQDAFTMLSAYKHRTPVMKNTILQVATDRAAALTDLDQPARGGVREVSARLARVQALFVHVFVRLFDGAVHSRVSAQTQVPTLRIWLTQLWEAASRLQGEEGGCEDGFAGVQASIPRAWRLWILTESVRRTLLVVETILNTYQTMTEGWLECAGIVMLSTRRGLWDATSPVQWTQLCEQGPLMIPAAQPEICFEVHRAEEIDDFAKLLWTYIAGPEKIQCWVDTSSAGGAGLAIPEERTGTMS